MWPGSPPPERWIGSVFGKTWRSSFGEVSLFSRSLATAHKVDQPVYSCVLKWTSRPTGRGCSFRRNAPQPPTKQGVKVAIKLWKQLVHTLALQQQSCIIGQRLWDPAGFVPLWWMEVAVFRSRFLWSQPKEPILRLPLGPKRPEKKWLRGLGPLWREGRRVVEGKHVSAIAVHVMKYVVTEKTQKEATGEGRTFHRSRLLDTST